MSETKKGPITVMAHLVAGYPNDGIARAAARGLAAGGVSYFEVQFPFSDPSADGKSIQTACAGVLGRGYRVSEGFDFVASLRRDYPDIPCFIMTYANLAYRNGIADFASRAAESGASGLIVPDLPFDADEGLDAECVKRGLTSVPVAAPSMSASRLAKLASLGRPYVYAALRAGITGATTTIDGETLAFIRAVSASGDTGNAEAGPESPILTESASKVLGGFGIRTGAQSSALKDAVHAVVAGSVFVDIIAASAGDGPDAVYGAIRAKAAELSGMV
jgi:tryptophan synthase alpha chain